MITKSTTISLVFKGLNQIFRHKKLVFTHYSELESYLETSKLLESKSELIKSFTYTNEEILAKLCDFYNFRLILSPDYDCNWSNANIDHDKYLSIDKKLIDAQGLNRYFTFLNWEELKSEIEMNPKRFVIFNENSYVLNKYKKASCWTSLLTDLFYSFLEETSPYVKDLLNKNTIEFPKEEFYYKEYFDFQAVSVLQNAYYFSVISINPLISIKDYLKDNRVVKVLTFFRILPKISDFPKTDFLESNNKVIYINHLGGNDITLNNEFNMISPRITDFQDLISYNELYKNAKIHADKNNILFINEPNHIEPFLFRSQMSEMLKKFSAEFMKQDKFKGLKVEFPSYIQAPTNSICDAEHFKQLLKKSSLELPLIIKYNSQVKEDNHLLTLLVSETGISHLVEYYRSRSEDQLESIIQQFHNHGGVFAKTFFVKNEASVILRSSFPDIPEDEDLKNKIYKDGHLFLHTKQIATDFLNKYSLTGKPASLDILNHEINKEFLLEITHKFNSFSNVNLFSLDFVIDQKTQIYYILDCNFYPAYKEYKSGIGSLLAEHHYLIYSDYLSKISK